MSKDLATTNENKLASIDNDTYSALKNSIFPGAKDDSIAMVLSYCQARGLDPLQKPVHIVPMYIKDAKTQKGEMRDVVMPGIGLYRIQAQRSGQYAGQSDPEFGEDVTETLNGVKVTYPKWCKISIKKQMQNGIIVDFPAKEYWKENYATKGKDSDAPNAMWKKRPYAQLAKCTEAQALRKAFPDIIDQSPTAEEMEGKGQHENYKADHLNEKYNLYEGETVKQEKHAEPATPHKDDDTTSEEEPYTFDGIKMAMETVQSYEDLNEIASVISEITITEEQRKELQGIYRKKQKELNPNK